MPAIGQSHKGAVSANRQRAHKKPHKVTVKAPSAAAVQRATVPHPTHVRQARKTARTYVARQYTPPSADRHQAADFARANKYKKSDAYVRALNAGAKSGYKNAKTKAERDRIFGKIPKRGVQGLPKKQRKAYLRQAGLGLEADAFTKFYGNMLKDAKELVTQTPSSVYLTGHAAVKLAEGHPGEAKSLARNFVKTDPVALALQGKFKKAAQAAYNRPVSTALEFTGAKAVTGRTLGAVARHSPSAAVRRAASTERAPMRLYRGTKPGEGPAIGRRYSKDLITKGAQVAVERHRRRRGEDPNERRPERTTKNMSGGRTALKPSVGAMKHPLDERVDLHVHAQHVMQQKVVRAAERKAKAREKRGTKRQERVGRQPKIVLHRHRHPVHVPRRPMTPDEAAASFRNAAILGPQGARDVVAHLKATTKKQMAVHKHTTSFGHEGLDAEHVAHQAHDVLGLKKPVVTRIMPASLRKSLTEEMGREPRAYTRDMGDHYRIDINPHHPGNKSPKGVSNAMHYELGRAQGLEHGKRGPGPVSSAHNRASYFDNANTTHAQRVLHEHVNVDLRHPAVTSATPHQPGFTQLPELKFSGSPRPSRVEEASQKAARAALHTHMRKVVDDLAIDVGHRGHVSTYDLAKKALPAEEARVGEKLIPVNVGRLTRIPEEPVVAKPEGGTRLRLATMNERAWKQAVEVHAPGQWKLMPERVVKRFIAHAEVGRQHGVIQKTSNVFKDVVLTTANPVRWLGGNVTDLGMRSLNEGLTPADLYRGAKVYRELGKHGRRGELVRASTTGGGFGHLARDVSREVSTPGAKHLAKLWGHYRAGVYGIESAIESLPQLATVGKELRTGSKISVRHGLKGLLRATDDQVQHFATKMTTDHATEMQIARHVDDVIGKWGKLSPEARRLLSLAPFAQWLGAATKYVLITLPVKHPIKTGIMAAMNQMTEKERQALGLSQYLPLKKQAQDYQMMTLPQHIGHDKYGKYVRGTDLARALSFGTVSDAVDLNVGGYLFPQFQGALAAANGVSWTGERLVYAEGTPNAGMDLSAADKRKVAIGMLIETMTPGASMFRRVVQEKGRPSMPQSTILTPEVRKRYDPKTKTEVTPKGSTKAAIKRVTGAPIPGLPQEKRVYTKGVVNEIDRNRITGSQLKVWNAKRQKQRKTGDPEVDAFGGTGTKRDSFGKAQAPKTKVKDPEVAAFK